MIAIYPDCNALWRNVTLSNDVGRRLRDKLGTGDVELHLSQVVIAELRRRAEDEMAAAKAEGVTAIQRATKGAAVDTKSLLRDHDALFDRIAAGIEAQFAELLSIDGVVVDEWPDLTAQEMGERELARRRPFIDTTEGTIGHRDALVWAGVVAGAEYLYERDDVAVFVSKDRGFRADEGRGLHPDLQSDVDEVFEGSFEFVPSLFDALTVIDLRDEAITRRQANIRNAFGDLLEHLRGSAWEWLGGELPPDMENPSVISAEYLGDESIGDGTPAICEFRAYVEIEGAMRKDTYLLDSGMDVKSWDGEINDHYVSVYVEREVIFEVEVDVSEAGEVDYIDIRSVLY